MKPHIYKRGSRWFVRCDNPHVRILYPGAETVLGAWNAAIERDCYTSNRIPLAQPQIKGVTQ